MTRDEFIAEAKARGKSKEETRRKFDELEAAGKFDDSEPIKQPHGATRSFEAPTYEERVQEVADKEAVKSLESQKKDTGIANRILSPIDAFTGTVIGQINETAPYKAAGKAISWGINKLPNTPLDPLLNKAVSKVGEGIEKLPEPIKHGFNIAGDIAQLVPGVGIGGKATAKGIEVGLEGGASALKKGGKALMTSQMKPKDVTALLAGKDVESGAKNIVNIIEKNKIESTTGGFEGISKNASKKIKENSDMADDAIKNAAAENPGGSIDIDNSFIDFIDDLENGKINSVFGDEAKAAEYANNVYKALELRGLSGIQTIDKIPEIKRIIENYAGGLFKKGKFAIQTDPVKSQVGELVYLRLKDGLEQFVPEIKKYNSDIHDLIIVKKAANEAVKRIGNKNQISLQDWIILFGGPTAAHSLGLPAFAAGAVPGAAIITKKAAGSGRGPSAMIGAGNTLETISKIGKKKIP